VNEKEELAHRLVDMQDLVELKDCAVLIRVYETLYPATENKYVMMEDLHGQYSFINAADPVITFSHIMLKLAERFMMVHRKDIRAQTEQAIADFKQFKNDERVLRAITKIVSHHSFYFSTAPILPHPHQHRPSTQNSQRQLSGVRAEKSVKERKFRHVLSHRAL
jgi:hypothetical protein